ncbi:reverse transcriptase domain-containing protein [Tanacetum coccineum]|uniref:Reverse transcriptase domain-containing protein n=1 Tax=Tanacetum coccineum TaxID=301880 RepID=A0ABQ5GQL5_9ASTR
MTKQGNVTQRTPQAKKQSDHASRQISKQASGSANAPYDLVFTAMGPPLGTTQTTATITSTEGLQRATFTTPPQTVPGTNTTEPPPPPIRNKGPELGADNLTLEGVATRTAPSMSFVSHNIRDFGCPSLQEETNKRSSQSPTGPDLTRSGGRRYLHRVHQKERRGKDNRRPPVFGRIGKENYRGAPQRSERSSQDSTPRTVRRKRRRRESLVLFIKDTSDNEDAETGHWKSKNKYREDEDEDMSRPWRRQKVDAFTRRISDFSEDKKRRMPANVKTYDGTGDPDDHLKIFESAATIENWPQPVWCHMFNSTLVGNARNWFSKLPRRSIDGFEELRRAFRLNFTQVYKKKKKKQRKKCAKNPVELARVKQRQGESTSAYVERYKDECIHVKACPEILKISGFMNGINNPELIKRLNDRVPQTFDELMKRTRSFIQGEAAAADSRKGYSNNRSQEQSRRQSNDQSSSRNNSYRGQRGGRGNDKYTHETMTPKGDTRNRRCKKKTFPKPPPMRTPEEQRVGNGYCEYQSIKGHTTNETSKTVKDETKEREARKKSPRDNADTIYMWWKATYHRINAAVHDIHRMTLMGGELMLDILYEHCFQRLRPEVKSQLNPATTSLTGFTGEKIWPMGQLRLPVMVGNKEHSTTAWDVLKCDQITNAIQLAIICRPGISAKRAVPSTAHGMLKFPVDGGIVTIYNTAAPPKECNTVTCDVTQTQRQHTTKVTNLKVAIHPDYPEQEVSIGGSLSDTGRAAVCALFQETSISFVAGTKHMAVCHYRITEHKQKSRLQRYSHPQDAIHYRKIELESGVLMRIPLKVRSLTCTRVSPNPNGPGTRKRRPFTSARSADKSTPFFKHSRSEQKGDFRWTTEAEKLTLLKQHIAALPTLVAPRPGEELIIYLSAMHGAISAMLLTDRDFIQTPVYFVSKALKETEINYSAMEKLVLALVFASKRLRRYFQAHPIVVITDQPIKQVISKPDAPQ